LIYSKTEKHPSKTQAGTKLAQEPPGKFQIARSCRRIVVHSYYVHRFQQDPIKQWNIFFLKKCEKCKAKKQPEKKTNQKEKKHKKMKKKQKAKKS